MSAQLSSRHAALKEANKAICGTQVPGTPPTVNETSEVAATFLEKKFAERVAASELKEGFVKSAAGTFFMGDQNFGFWGGFESENTQLDAAMICVPEMYDKLLEAIDDVQQDHKRKAIIILGNPGLGKSNFLVYKAVRLLQEGCTLLWHSAGRLALYTQGTVYGLTEEQAKQVLRSRSDIHYLMDGVTPMDVHQASPMLMLLAHTPDRSNYKAMQRRPDAFARALYFHEWDPPDLKHLWQKAYPDITHEQMEERLQLRGGNPRIVLARAIDESDHDSIDKAPGRSTWQMLSSVMNPHSGITDGFSHQLCIDDVTDWRSGDFCKTVVRPVSPQIGARIGQAATSKYKVEMTTYVGAGGSSKGAWQYKREEAVKTSAAAYMENVKPLYLRRFTLPQTMQAAAEVLTADVLFLPNDKVFESVDAICPSRGYVIHNTVADKHDLKFCGLREVFKVFPAGIQITVFFMVPPDRLDKFKKSVVKFDDAEFSKRKATVEVTSAAQAQYNKQAEHTQEEEADFKKTWVEPTEAERAQYVQDKRRAENMKQVVVAVSIDATSDVNTVILPTERYPPTPGSTLDSPTAASLTGSQPGRTPFDQRLPTSYSSNMQYNSSAESSSSRALQFQ